MHGAYMKEEKPKIICAGYEMEVSNKYCILSGVTVIFLQHCICCKGIILNNKNNSLYLSIRRMNTKLIFLKDYRQDHRNL